MLKYPIFTTVPYIIHERKVADSKVIRMCVARGSIEESYNE